MRRSHRLRRAVVVAAAMTFAACSALSLGEVEQESVVTTTTLDPTRDFGTVTIGAMSTPATVTLAIAGSQDETHTVNGVSSSSTEFIVSFPNGSPPATISQMCSVAMGASGSTTTCTGSDFQFDVTFAPTGLPGMRSGTIHYGIDGSDNTLTFTGSAVAPSKTIKASPNPVPFGYQQVGTASTGRDLQISNTGSASLNITSVVFDDAGGVFAQTAGPTGPHTLPATGVETYTFTCDPPAQMTYTGHLTITSDATNTPTLVVALTCTGTDSTLSTTPDPATFAPMRVGDPGVPLTITVHDSNTTAGDSIDSYALASGMNPDLTISDGTNIGPISSATPKTVKLLYTPTTAVAANGVLGTLIVNYNGSKQYQATIFGEADPTALSIVPASLDFGPLCQQQSKTQTITLYASDVGGFRLQSISTPGAPFSRTLGSGVPANIPGRHMGEFTFDVTAQPTGSATATYNDTITLTTDIPNDGSAAISVSAKGLPGGISPSPASLDFPATNVEATSSGQNVTLTNCGTSAINVQSATITGTDAGDFAVVLPSDPAKMLQLQDAETFTLVMSPHSKGIKTANLVIAYDTGSTVVPLDGVANGGSATTTSPKNRETYYACSTGQPVSALPIAAALGLLARRRRRK